MCMVQYRGGHQHQLSTPYMKYVEMNRTNNLRKKKRLMAMAK